MHEKRDHDALKIEIERGHFVRAALVEEEMGLPKEETGDLRRKALGQMAAVSRNAHGTRSLAHQYGFSREEVRKLLEEIAQEMKNEGNTKPLEPCYDYSISRYLSFEEWMDHYLKMKIWDKLLG
jgi:hypothetical protein